MLNWIHFFAVTSIALSMCEYNIYTHSFFCFSSSNTIEWHNLDFAEYTQFTMNCHHYETHISRVNSLSCELLHSVCILHKHYLLIECPTAAMLRKWAESLVYSGISSFSWVGYFQLYAILSSMKFKGRSNVLQNYKNEVKRAELYLID